MEQFLGFISKEKVSRGDKVRRLPVVEYWNYLKIIDKHGFSQEDILIF